MGATPGAGVGLAGWAGVVTRGDGVADCANSLTWTTGLTSAAAGVAGSIHIVAATAAIITGFLLDFMGALRGSSLDGGALCAPTSHEYAAAAVRLTPAPPRDSRAAAPYREKCSCTSRAIAAPTRSASLSTPQSRS
jgi:hypothetical protein